MSAIDDEDIARFKQFLTENGAKWPKIDWPSNETESGIRGAVALEDIATNEHMLEIPEHLMMSPPRAYESDIGPYLKQNQDIIKPDSDVFLTIFIMSERRKGINSFFYPFLKILPEPGSVAHWSDDELRALQDEALLVRAKGRIQLVQNTFRRTVGVLSVRHPEIFPPDQFTIENYKFCWYSIMARAFGKRLPWTSLVPFADCLNHTNVQTKYDYNVDSNGTFRLFPTGKNSYPKGTEVFNSYGRRPNNNLLMDYGFSMENNEWDRVEITLTLPESEHLPLYETKRRILYDIGRNYNLTVDLSKSGFPLIALDFLRVIVLTGPEISYLLQKMGIPEDNEEEDNHDKNKTVPAGSRDMFDRLQIRSSFRAQRRRCFGHVVSLSSELSALTTLRGVVRTLVSSRITSVDEDEELLANVSQWPGPDGPDATLGTVSGPPHTPSFTFSNTPFTAPSNPLTNPPPPPITPSTDRLESKLSSDPEPRDTPPHTTKTVDFTEETTDVADKQTATSTSTPLLVEEARWRRRCAIVYRLTKKRLVDATLCKLDVLDGWLRRTLAARSNHHHPLIDETTERDSELDIRNNASALIQDLMAAGSDIGNQLKGLQIETTSSSSSASSAAVVPPLSTSSKSTSSTAGDKKQQSDEEDTMPGSLELEVYVKLLCNPALPAYLIQKPGPPDNVATAAAAASAT